MDQHKIIRKCRKGWLHKSLNFWSFERVKAAKKGYFFGLGTRWTMIHKKRDFMDQRGETFCLNFEVKWFWPRISSMFEWTKLNRFIKNCQDWKIQHRDLENVKCKSQVFQFSFSLDFANPKYIVYANKTLNRIFSFRISSIIIMENVEPNLLKNRWHVLHWLHTYEELLVSRSELLETNIVLWLDFTCYNNCKKGMRGVPVSEYPQQ